MLFLLIGPYPIKVITDYTRRRSDRVNMYIDLLGEFVLIDRRYSVGCNCVGISCRSTNQFWRLGRVDGWADGKGTSDEHSKEEGPRRRETKQGWRVVSMERLAQRRACELSIDERGWRECDRLKPRISRV